MSPELAAYKLINTLKLPAKDLQLRIRNEWDKADKPKHALIVAIGSDYDVDLPATWEGYELRRVRWGK